jgi:adenylate cyclase
VPFAGFVWEVDEFHGGREGLIVAEIELPDAETQFPLPVFIGEEVTGDAAYYNSNL